MGYDDETAEAASPPENGKIAFLSLADGTIDTIEPDGSNLNQLASGTSANWSPDGTKLVLRFTKA
jgi:hypothetical protein